MVALESLLVTLIVIVCAAFSLWRLMSARMRLRILDYLTARVGRSDRGPLARIREKALAELGGGCGACTRAPRVFTAVSPPANRTPAAPRR